MADKAWGESTEEKPWGNQKDNWQKHGIDKAVKEDENIDIQKLCEIEKKAYADTIYAQMQGFENIRDLAEYCEVSPKNVHVMSGDDWYVILGEHRDHIEIVDLASTGKRLPVKQVLEFMKSFDKPVTMDAREETSYKLVKALDRMHMLQINKDESYQWGGETFHDVEAEIEK